MSNNKQTRLPLPSSIQCTDEALIILNQCLLPDKIETERLATIDSVFRAILELRVRGAPAIGIVAAYGLVQELKHYRSLSKIDFLHKSRELANYLNKARPTAVNLYWSMQQVCTMIAKALDAATDSSELWELSYQKAKKIHQDDTDICTKIGNYGRPWIKPGQGLLTHCNAGSLATSGIGTALAPMYMANIEKIPFRVYANETRPLLQGARLTVLELMHAGIDVTLLCDSSATYLMAQKKIDLVIVGTDRVAANGDVVNKIGTLQLAIAAHHFGIPFLVACPSSTFDPNLDTGADTIIEQRSSEEVTKIAGWNTTLPDANVYNPAFDITPAKLVTCFITDKGELHPPYNKSLSVLAE